MNTEDLHKEIKKIDKKAKYRKKTKSKRASIDFYLYDTEYKIIIAESPYSATEYIFAKFLDDIGMISIFPELNIKKPETIIRFIKTVLILIREIDKWSEIERLRKLYKEKSLKVRSDCCKTEMRIVSIKNVDYNKCTKCGELCNWIGDDEFENNIKKKLESQLKQANKDKEKK